MGFAGYVTVCVQLYCVSCPCLTLHVSAYMAIFKCVGYFIFICLKDSASLLCFRLFFHVVTLCMFPSMRWVKYEVLLFIITYAIFVVLYIFFLLTCFLPVLFSFVNFAVSLRVCLSACFFFVVCLFWAAICCLFRVGFWILGCWVYGTVVHV
jgi:hypothetical protein